MAQHLTYADLKGFRASKLTRIYAAARDAVVAAGAMTADRFDAHVRAMAGTDKPRDLALCALDQVALFGSRIVHRAPSQQSQDEGIMLGDAPVHVFGHGPALARQIIAAA